MSENERAGRKFAELIRILDDLRGERGCSWDREQDEKTISDYFLEEAYEAVDAVGRGNPTALSEELGDVLMEVVFLARIHKEKGEFSILEVLNGINDKMIRRHPHVFSGKAELNSDQVLEGWTRQKKKEKSRDSVLDGLVKTLPALFMAFQIGNRVSACGFDWTRPEDALQKVREEFAELEKAIRDRKEDDVVLEIGDILFAVANVARHLGVNPEMALRRANEKFIRRFKYIEERLREQGKDIFRAELDEMDSLWEEAKKTDGSD